jgi:hypothetical protein
MKIVVFFFVISPTLFLRAVRTWRDRVRESICVIGFNPIFTKVNNLGIANLWADK